MRVRRAEVGDTAKVVEMSGALFREDAGEGDSCTNLDWPEEEGREYFSGLIADEDNVCLLAEYGGKAVGYLAGRMKAGDTLRPVKLAELESMYVWGERRGRGTGASLVGEFLRWAGEKGAERSSVTAYAANERAIRFYESLGFRPLSLSLEKEV